MALDMKAWLLEMGVKPDAIDTVLPALAPAADSFERATLRQSDYSKLTNDLTAKQTALDAANERLNSEILDWNAARDAGEPITEKMRLDLAKAEGAVARLTSVITTRATELGLDPKTIIGDVAAPPVKVDPPVVDLSGYAKQDDINARLGRFADYMMLLPAEVNDLAQEHFDLTGQRLSTRAIMQEVRDRAANKSNFDAQGNPRKPIDARAVWEETHNIPALRATKQKESHDAELKAAEDRGYERAATERSLPGAEAPGRHAVVFRHRDPNFKPTMPRGPVQQLDRQSQATTALATHKYRQKAS